MRNARTFAASASSWPARARRIAFSCSTAAEEGSEDEEGDEEEGDEAPPLLGFFPLAALSCPAAGRFCAARAPCFWSVFFEGCLLMNQGRKEERQVGTRTLNHHQALTRLSMFRKEGVCHLPSCMRNIFRTCHCKKNTGVSQLPASDTTTGGRTFLEAPLRGTRDKN